MLEGHQFPCFTKHKPLMYVSSQNQDKTSWQTRQLAFIPQKLVVLDFIVYTGTDSDIEDVGAGLGKRGDIVIKHFRPYLDNSIFMVNWCTSPTFFLRLYDKATNKCGTVRKNPNVTNGSKVKREKLTYCS